MKRSRPAAARPARYRSRWIGLAVAACLAATYVSGYLAVRSSGVLARSRSAVVSGAPTVATAADVAWSFQVEPPLGRSGAWVRIPFYPLVRGEEELCSRVEGFARADKEATLDHLRAHWAHGSGVRHDGGR